MGQAQPADLYIRGFLHRGFAGNRHYGATDGLEHVPIYRGAVHKEFNAVQLRESDSCLFIVINNLIGHRSIQVCPSRRAVQHSGTASGYRGYHYKTAQIRTLLSTITAWFRIC